MGQEAFVMPEIPNRRVITWQDGNEEKHARGFYRHIMKTATGHEFGKETPGHNIITAMKNHFVSKEGRSRLELQHLKLRLELATSAFFRQGYPDEDLPAYTRIKESNKGKGEDLLAYYPILWNRGYMDYNFHLTVCKYAHYVDAWLQAAHNLGLMEPLTRAQSADLGEQEYWDRSLAHTNDPMVTHRDTLTAEVEKILKLDKYCRHVKMQIAGAVCEHDNGEALPVDSLLLAQLAGTIPDTVVENPGRLYT